jgi:hypothetical protein
MCSNLQFNNHVNQLSDAASERRGSLLTMPNRKEEGKANQINHSSRQKRPQAQSIFNFQLFTLVH